MLRDGQEYVDAGAEYYEKQIRTGRCARPSAGRRNWAISWCLSPMHHGSEAAELDSFS